MRIPHDPQFAWSVQEVNRGVHALLAEGFDQPIWVQGELGRVQSGARNTIYSTLKDPDGTQISLVHFGGAAEFQRQGLATGSTVMVLAQVDCYIRNGTYQLKALRIMPAVQQNGLMQRYLETRDRLAAEGLFDTARKRPLPALPRCIGVLTSAHGAAVHDFIKTALARVPNLHIRVTGVKVQGDGAAREIRQALDFLNAEGTCDVIVITRGGGSMEDLWEFNDEALVRAVAASRTPVVSAVGHQIDSTLCDFAADCTVITPTEAAVKVTEVAYEAVQRLAQLRQRLVSAQRILLAEWRNRLTRAMACPALTHPESLYTQQTMRLERALAALESHFPQRLERERARLNLALAHLKPLLLRQTLMQKSRLGDAVRRLPDAVRAILSEASANLRRQTALLEAFNPRGVLKRGYSVLLDKRGQAVRAPSQVASGDALKALLAEGEIQLKVK